LIIVCNSCSAQYSVSDAKVRGKLVRITCKHCSSAIVVDGRQMSEVEVAPQKLSSYALPRRDESVVAAMPQSMPAPAASSSAARSAMTALAPAAGSAHAPTASSARSPQSAMQSAMTAALREEDQTMVTRSRFGDEMSVHEERTVIGQIPKEALEFERMFAQRTQPPPPDAPSAPAHPAPVAALPNAGPLPSFASEDSEPPAGPLPSFASEDSERPVSDDAESAGQATLSAASEPPAVGNKPTSDTRGLVTLAEATQPSVARSVSARRVRVTLITILVLAVLVLLFVTQKPH
jgi:predicted Zn finger-like uncharacterized protein